MAENNFEQHLRTDQSPFVLKRRETGPSWQDEEVHARALHRDRERYALSAVAAGVQLAQRARVLYNLLRLSRAELSQNVTTTVDRVTHLLAAVTPADEVLTVFLSLRRGRVNNRHVQRYVMAYILNHPCVEDLVWRRRAAVVDCIEHAIGRNVARGCARRLDAEHAPGVYVQRNLLRYATNESRATAAFRSLYRQGELPACTDRASSIDYHKRFETKCEANCANRPKTVTATNRGDIAATLVHLYRGGDNPELRRALEKFVENAAAAMPRFAGSVSLALDLSASTRGYGDREFCCVSQSVALRLVLERCCRQLYVHQLGGVGCPPRPEGHTDLATALLDALDDNSDVVAIVSDGYENAHGGDLARVAESLTQMGVETPVLFCHSKFSAKDGLQLRRPAAALPEVEFWHEADFEEVLHLMFSMARGNAGRRFAHDVLYGILQRREKEVISWSSTN